MALYHLGLMGAVDNAVAKRLTETLRNILTPLGIAGELDVTLAASTFKPPTDYASAAVFFGDGKVRADEAQLTDLMRNGTPILPVVGDLEEFSKLVPACLRPINGFELKADDKECEHLATTILEIMGLLPRQRRIFLSYRRTESRDAAVQLFEKLAARQFDVFLDTHDVPPGADFQEVLWHRLCDSDALVMLDTKDYFESRWTTEEFGRALAKSLVPVRIGWPGVNPARTSISGESIQLKDSDFEAGGKLLKSETIDRIALAIEKSRSRGIGFRSMEMVSRLATVVQKVGGKFIGLAPKRTAVIELHSGHQILAYPSVGVPTAEHLHDAATLDFSGKSSRAVIYDDVGIARRWQVHLDWLGQEIKSVRWLPLAKAAWDLSVWESPP